VLERSPDLGCETCWWCSGVADAQPWAMPDVGCAKRPVPSNRAGAELTPRYVRAAGVVVEAGGSIFSTCRSFPLGIYLRELRRQMQRPAESWSARVAGPRRINDEIRHRLGRV
jgi:hypothetical protein